MIEFVLFYILMAYGLCNLLVYGYGPFDIIYKFRMFCYKQFPEVAKMLECMMCTSTNIGFIMSIINILIIPSIPFTPFNYIFSNISLWYLIIPFDAFITSGCVWLIHTVQEALESLKKEENEL
jgi:hypothetical protein